MVRVYHQVGHNFKWNLDSFLGGFGDGLIFAPRSVERQRIEALESRVRGASFFDPQYFSPNQMVGKMNSYDFHPSLVEPPYSSIEYVPDGAHNCAVGCVDFQSGNRFNYGVIPTVYFDATPSDFFQIQEGQFITPFLNAFERIDFDKEILLQIVVNEHMLSDDSFRNSLLNFATGFEDIDGVYLIPNVKGTYKQVDDINSLVSLMRIVREFKDNDMTVILGYQNTEAFLMLAAFPDGVTVGSYENMRNFNIRDFQPRENRQMRGPNARMYFSKLLQWVDFRYVEAMQKYDNDFAGLVDQSRQIMELFRPDFNWNFSKSEPYKHFFEVFTRQLKQVSSHEGTDRIEAIREEISRARNEYSRLEDQGIVFEDTSGGSHLASWLTTLNLFSRSIG